MTRVPINEGMVDRAYEVLLNCLTRVEEHFRFCAALQDRYPFSRGEKAMALEAKDLGAIVDALNELRVATEEAERLLIPLERDLPALHDAAVRSGSVIAASWAEATVMVARNYVRQLEWWERFDPLDIKEKKQHFSACFDMLPNVKEFQASLKIESARLRDRAVAMSSDVRFGYVLRELTGQSAKLMQLLIDREGRRVEYQEIGEALWGDDEPRSGKIQKAMHRLKRELESLGSGEIGRDIRSESGAYQFRGKGR